jgi:hypothetical protein
MTARCGAIALAIVLCAGPAAAKTFTDRFVGPTQALGQALSQTVARSLPVTSASPGLTFSYDPASGAFVRDTDLLGQLYLERARPIGKGKWNLTVSYQHVHVDAVQGHDLDSLRDNTLPIITQGSTNNPNAPTGNVLLKFPRYDVGLSVDEVTLAATYGITDNLDVNLTLPILISALSINATALTFTRNPNDNSLVPSGRRGNRFSQGNTTATGVGDLFLRGKYRAYTTGSRSRAASCSGCRRATRTTSREPATGRCRRCSTSRPGASRSAAPSRSRASSTAASTWTSTT